MKWRTTTRPNGQRDHRETILGWDVWLPRLVSIIAILGAVWVASARISAIETKIEAQAVTLPDKIAVAIAANAKTDDYVRRDEWLTYKEAQEKSLQQMIEDLRTATQLLYRTNYLFEKQPKAAKVVPR